MKKVFSLFLILFLSVFIFANLSLLSIPEYFPDYRYFANTIIHFIYLLSTFCNSILIIILIFNLFTKKNIKFENLISNGIISICSFSILLIWIELFYSSIWYYGGIGNHQNLPIGANNLGLYGSFIECIFLLIFIGIPDEKTMKIKILIFIFIILAHYLLYKFL